MSIKFTGTGVALVTPFNEQLNVDYDGLKKLLNHTSEGGVDYFVVNGTTGESPTTTSEEKAAILQFVKENNPLKLPIVYGIGGNNTQAVLDTISQTDLEDVDAILSVCPSYNKPPQEGIFRHFTKIADSSPVPVILYNVPARTSCNISVKTTAKLAAHQNIIGTKEASGDILQCMDIKRNTPVDFLLISGVDLLSSTMISMGAVGTISVVANAFPRIFSDMIRYSLRGDLDKITPINDQLSSIDNLLYKEANPTGVKHILKVMGICDHHVRLPLVNASSALQAEIQRVMTGLL